MVKPTKKAEERAASQAAADKVQLVWSGVEIEDGTRSRDTSTVVQEMFRAARKSVLIASFVLDQGHKARAIFGAWPSAWTRIRGWRSGCV